MMQFTGTYTDYYQLTMAEIYFLSGRKDQLAVFDYYFRQLPFQGGYAIFAGLADVLDALEALRFDAPDIDFLHQQGFNADFLDYLKHFRFRGTIQAVPEGEVVFPNTPILSVEATIIEAQLIETLLLNLLNFQTLIATKASRMRQAAGQRELVDFGLRRAQGPAGYYASRAAIIGGFDATSNVRAARDYQIPLVGTMAHAFIQSYAAELSAFEDFAKSRPEACVLLVDTYNTLHSGMPNAIKVAKDLEARGYRLKGVRLDSGDFAYLSKHVRAELDAAGLSYVKIVVSNKLDEQVIKHLLEQQAPIDTFGVGTRLVIGEPDAALDGVYKLVFSDNQPRIKLSESMSKVTLPDRKQVYRVLDDQGDFLGADVVALANELAVEMMHHPLEPLKKLCIGDHQQVPLRRPVMVDGRQLLPTVSLKEISAFRQARLGLLPSEYQRFQHPHLYKVGISTALKSVRDELMQQYR